MEGNSLAWKARAAACTTFILADCQIADVNLTMMNPFQFLVTALLLVHGQGTEEGSVMVTFADGWTPYNEYNALYSLFTALNMNSDESRPMHNWFPSGLRQPSEEDYCNFTGVSCDHERYVVSLVLNSKGLTGMVPDDVANLSRLQRLRMGDNSIGGSLPGSLSTMTSLQHLYIGRNYLSGNLVPFPEALISLFIGRNSFRGTIPESLCKLTDLSVLDLSFNTKMWGKLPDCLADLTSLTKFRITDVGLIGTIPSELCTVREMNGLSRNKFGCDAIGCPEGYYQRSGGRQHDVQTKCERCRVPSNVIASTRCHWYHHNQEQQDSVGGEPNTTTPTLRPTFGLTETPSTVKPSSYLDLHAQHETQSPAPIDALKILPTAAPPTAAATPSRSPTSSVIGGIVENPGPVGDSDRKSVVVACSIIGVALVFLVAALTLFAARSWKSKQRLESTSSHGILIRSEVANSEGPLPEVDPHRNKKSGAAETPRATEQGPSLLRNKIVSQQLPRPVSARRVRFKLPDPLSWSFSGESAEEEISESDEEEKEESSKHIDGPKRTKPKTWSGWINPVLDGICGPLSSPQQDDNTGNSETSAQEASESSSCHSVAPLLSQGSETSSLHYWLETASRQQVSGIYPTPQQSPSSLLGIRGRQYMDGTREALAARKQLIKSLEAWHKSNIPDSSSVMWIEKDNNESESTAETYSGLIEI